MRGMSAAVRNIEPPPIEVFEVEEGAGFGISEPGWYAHDPETGKNIGPFPTRDEALKPH